MGVALVAEKPRHPRLVEPPPPEQAEPAPALIIQQAPDPRDAEFQTRARVLSQTGATLHVVSRVLAVRLQLLLALIGAFVLALGAMQWQTPAGLYVLIAWAVLTILPIVWLEYSGRPRG